MDGSRRTFVVATMLIALGSCTDRSTRSADPEAVGQTRPLRAEIASACAGAKEDSAPSFRVLCPARLPRASVSSVPGNPPAPLRVVPIRDARGRVHGLEFSYSAPDGHHPERNHPDRFLHFAVLGTGSGFSTPLGAWDDLGTAELGDRHGHLYFVPAPSYHREHLVFVWREDGTRMVASLHSWDRTETLRLLDSLVSGLTPPARAAASPRPDRRVTTTRLGRYGAIEVTVGPESAWALGYTQGKLFPLDPAGGGRSGPPIDLGRYPTDLVLDGSTIWVARHDDTGTDVDEDGVLRVDLEDGGVDVFSAGESPRRIAIAGGHVWVVDSADGTLRALDRRNGRVTLGPVAVGGALVAAATYRGHVLGLDAERARIVWVDGSSGRIVRRTALGGSLGGIAVGHGSVWVTDHGNRTLVRVDATTGDVIATIPLPGMPGRVAARRGSVWVTDYWGGRLVRVDPRTNRIEDRTHVGGHPLEIVIGAGAVWVVDDGAIQRVAL